jgi:serine protease AprX
VTYPFVRFAGWRWIAATLGASLIALASLTVPTEDLATPASSGQTAGTAAAAPNPALAQLAAERPSATIEAIVQLGSGTTASEGRALVRAAGGDVIRELPIIGGFGVRMRAGDAARLARDPAVHAVTLNSAVRPTAVESLTSNNLATSYNQSVRTDRVWRTSTGKGVGIAVVDTGIAGDLPDFRRSVTDPASRVVATAVTNPDATNGGDGFGHGTHVAGLIAGNGNGRDVTDPLRGRYVGAAPEANLISVKVSDDDGGITLLDVIYGLQFVLDHKDDYNIRVVNLSLNATESESYRTDPLDAAVEELWFSGIVVVAAAGNRGTDPDAVSYAPANDPYVISVGAVDDRGTNDTDDDLLADWSSRGTTQDGFSKPEVLSPGAHIVSTLAPGSDFTSLCPSCVRDGQYFQAGGTSMAAPIVAGIVADLLAEHPSWTPDQVKGALLNNLRDVPGTGAEADAQHANSAKSSELVSNDGLEPSSLIEVYDGTGDPSQYRLTQYRLTQYRLTRYRLTWAPATLTGASGATWVCQCSDEAVVEDGAESDHYRLTRYRLTRYRLTQYRLTVGFSK